MSFRSITSKHQSVVDAIAQEHREASVWLPFGALEIAQVFTEEEAARAGELIERLRDAGDDAQREAMLARDAERFARPVLGLLRLARVL